MPKTISRNKYDLLFIALAMLLIPLTWFFILGWAPDLTIPGNDGISSTQPHLIDFFSKGGHWRDFLLRFEPNGGAAGHAIGSTVPLYEWCAFFGISSGMSENLCCFLIQLLIGFFSFRIISDLSRRLTVTEMIGVIFLCGFSPVVAWRLAYGHEMLISGFIPLLVIVSMLLSFRVQSISLPQLAMIFLALTHSVAGAGQQGFIYGLFFGLPFIGVAAALTFSSIRQKKQRTLLFCLLCLGLSAVLSILPRYSEMIAYALGSDASRSVSSTSVVYGYVTGTFLDWFSSIPWTLQLFTPDRPLYLWHEVNYAVGPLLLFIGFLFRKHRGWVIAFLVGALFSICFSNDLWPSNLLAQLPLIKNFRVPERSFIVTSLFTPILGCAALLTRLQSPKRFFRSFKLIAPYVGLALLMLIVDGDQQELILWCIGIFIGAATIVNREEINSYLRTDLILLLFCIGCTSAFKERLLPFNPIRSITQNAETLREMIVRKAPDLDDPLVRIKFEGSEQFFGANLGSLLRLSTVDGYWLPTARFVKLQAAMNRIPPDLTRNYIMIPTNAPGYEPLRVLYNMGWKATLSNPVDLQPLDSTAGKAWFSNRVEFVKDYNEIASHIGDRNIRSTLASKNYVLTEDSQKLNPSVDCKGSEVLSTSANRVTQKIELVVNSKKDDCPLTVSLNYLGFLKARSEGKEIHTFPAYGALLGLSVPRGKHSIIIQPEAISDGWSSASTAAAMILGFFSLYLYYLWYRRLTSKAL